jgi:hypothetical protein
VLPAAVLEQAATFYQQQLDRYPEARRYLEQRGLRDPVLIKELRIGYAPGGSLRRHLAAQGYSCDLLQRLGLLNPQGCDAFYWRVIFPCCQGARVVNLYGRSIAAAFAHRFLPGSKGGLFAWESTPFSHACANHVCLVGVRFAAQASLMKGKRGVRKKENAGPGRLAGWSVPPRQLLSV